MLFSRDQFEQALRDKLSHTTRGETLDNTVTGMMRELDNVMGLERGSLINTQHISTLYAYYEDRSKRMANYGDKDQMFESKYRARAIEHIAQQQGSSVFTLRTHANKEIIHRLLDVIQESMPTTDYDRISTPYMYHEEPHKDAEDAQHTNEALIRKPEPRKTIEPRQPTKPREKPAKAEKPVEHRPVETIRAEYKQAWGEVADAAVAKKIMYLATLTNSDTAAPWLNSKPDKFAESMEYTRDSARTYGVDVQRTLSRIDELYNEFHASRNQDVGQSR